MKKILLSLLLPIAIISFCTSDKATKNNVVYLHQQNKAAHSNLELLNGFISTGDVMLQFYADWCNPCKRMSPLVEAVAAFTPEVTFIKINRDYFQDLAKAYTITSIPTLIFLRNGKEIGRYDGGPLTEKKLQKLLNSIYD